MDKSMYSRLERALKGERIWELIFYEDKETLHYVVTSNKLRSVYFLYSVDMTIKPEAEGNNTIKLIAKAKSPDILHRRIEPL